MKRGYFLLSPPLRAHRNPSLFSLPCFLFYFLGDFWSETTQGTSMGRARIHFRGSWPIQGPFQPKKLAPKPKFWLFLPKKSFYENAHISGTRRPTGLAQVSKRPLDQGLRAWPFRLSVFTLVSKIAYVLSSPCIFHGMGQKSDSDLFWPFLTPPANPVQFFWLKMPSKCVPWIVLQVSPSTRTSRGSLRPPKWPSKAKNGQKITIFGLDRPILAWWPSTSGPTWGIHRRTYNSKRYPPYFEPFWL